MACFCFVFTTTDYHVNLKFTDASKKIKIVCKYNLQKYWLQRVRNLYPPGQEFSVVVKMPTAHIREPR